MVTIYSLDIVVSQFGTSPLFYVQFQMLLQVLQKAGQVVRHSHLFKKYSQFVVIHTVRGFSVHNAGQWSTCRQSACENLVYCILPGTPANQRRSTRMLKRGPEQVWGVLFARCVPLDKFLNRLMLRFLVCKVG